MSVWAVGESEIYQFITDLNLKIIDDNFSDQSKYPLTEEINLMDSSSTLKSTILLFIRINT